MYVHKALVLNPKAEGQEQGSTAGLAALHSPFLSPSSFWINWSQGLKKGRKY